MAKCIVHRSADHDNYSTPMWGARALFHREIIRGEVLEPCCGQGNIVLAYSEYFTAQHITASDIRTHQEVFEPKITFDGGIDFLSDHYKPDSFDVVVTNPPFSLAEEFAVKALEVAREKVMLLLRIQFLESVTRFKFLRGSPLDTVSIFSERLSMYPEGVTKRTAGGTAMYAWFVWNKLMPKRLPQIDWIPPGTKERFS